MQVRLTYAQKVIRGIDPAVNPVGVEEFMRLHRGTLDHLSHADFVREVRLARMAEQREPGHLRACAYGCEDAYDEMQTVIDAEQIAAAVEAAKGQAP